MSKLGVFEDVSIVFEEYFGKARYIDFFYKVINGILVL